MKESIDNPIFYLFNKELTKNNFKKKRGRNWFLEKDDVILAVNLQKSTYGDQFYINLNFYLKPLANIFDDPDDAKISIRISAILDNAQIDELRQSLDLENKLTYESRYRSLQKFINLIIHFFSTCTNLDMIRKTFHDKNLECYVTYKLRKLLFNDNS